MAKITGLDSVSFFVRNYAQTVDFYADKLGFVVDERSERAAVLRSGEFRILVHVGEGGAAPPGLAMHLHLQVDDVDGFYRGLRERGVDVSEPPEDRPWGLRTFHARDLNGYDWEFVQPIG